VRRGWGEGGAWTRERVDERREVGRGFVDTPFQLPRKFPRTRYAPIKQPRHLPTYTTSRHKLPRGVAGPTRSCGRACVARTSSGGESAVLAFLCDARPRLPRARLTCSLRRAAPSRRRVAAQLHRPLLAAAAAAPGMSKKDAKGGAGAAGAPGGDPLLDAQTALARERSTFQLTSSSFGHTLGEMAESVKKLADENASLKKRLAATEASEAAGHASFTAKAEAQTLELKQAEATIHGLKDRLARVPLEIKAAADAAKAVLQTEIDDLGRRLRDREIALERLADFRKERDSMIAEIRKLRDSLEKEVMAHQHDIAAMERRNIQDRDAVRTEMGAAMREAKARLLSQAAHHLDGSTKRIVAENEAMVAELAFQSAEAERLSKLNAKMFEDNTNLRRELDMTNDEVRELFRRSHALMAALRAARSPGGATNAWAAEGVGATMSVATGDGTQPGSAATATAAAAAAALTPSATTVVPPWSASQSTRPATVHAATGGSTRKPPRFSSSALVEKVRLPAGVKIPPAPTAAAAAAAAAAGGPSEAGEGEWDGMVETSTTTRRGPGGLSNPGSLAASSAGMLAGGPSDGGGWGGGGGAGASTAGLAEVLALRDEVAITRGALAAARSDLDAALDALVVLDSQRLEMLSLADDTILALLRTAAELKPIVGAARMERIEQEAAAVAAGSGSKAFMGAIRSLLSDAMVSAAVGAHVVVGGGGAGGGGGGAASSFSSSAAGTASMVATAIATAEASSRGETLGPTPADARAVCRLSLVLAARLRSYLSELARALPDPLTVDGLLLQVTTATRKRAGISTAAAASTSSSSSAAAYGKPQHPQSEESEEEEDEDVMAGPPSSSSSPSSSPSRTAYAQVPRTALEAATARRAAKDRLRSAHLAAAAEAAEAQAEGDGEGEGGERSPPRASLPVPRYNAYVHSHVGEATVDVPSLAPITLRIAPSGSGTILVPAPLPSAGGAGGGGAGTLPGTAGLATRGGGLTVKAATAAAHNGLYVGSPTKSKSR
jgi:hypothetical protein